MMDVPVVRNEVSYIDDGSDLKVPSVPEAVGSDTFLSSMDKIGKMAQDALLRSKSETDFFIDGILYCGNCQSPKSKFVERNGKRWLIPVDCACSLQMKKEKEEEEAEKCRLIESSKFTGQFISVDRLRECTFEHWQVHKGYCHDKEILYKNRLLRYVEGFPYMLEHGIGLLLYGSLGVGKSYGAACVVNALSRKKYSCIMTNFTSLFNVLWSVSGRQSYLDKLNSYDLLALDDVGTEYQSEYSRYLFFELIDSRYRSGRPLLVTSNLSLKQFQKDSSEIMRRAYSRLTEMCHPVCVEGVDRRELAVKKRYDLINSFLDGKGSL